MREDITGDLRKLHNEKLHNLCSLINIITVVKSRTMRWARNLMREMSNENKISVRRTGGKRPLGKYRWQNKIKMDFKEIRYEGVEWIHLTQYRDQQYALVIMVIKL
jgi:hypothetical protein